MLSCLNLKSHLNLIFLLGAGLFVACSGDDKDSGSEDDYRLTADKLSFDLPASLTSGHAVTISTNAPSALEWALSNDANSQTTDKPDWITGVSLSNAVANTNGYTGYTLTFGADANVNSSGASRTGYIRLEIGDLRLTIRVTQAGDALYVNDPNPSSFVDCPAAGVVGNAFTMETNSTATAPTSLTSDNTSMITNLNASRSDNAGNGVYLWTVTFDVSLNTTFEPRSATISITFGEVTKTVPVSQNAAWTPPTTNTTDGLANCYLVAPGSSVTIPITRAITIGGLSAAANATPGILWDDNGVITGTPTLSGSGASRTITVNASSKPGNAVIALKDAAGTIYWSWHIWVTDYNGSITWTNPNNTAYTFMDRNLGATEAALSLAGRGLFYQWGRKDPFPGGKAGTAGHAALDKFYGMPDAGSPDIVRVSNTAMDATGIAAGILESIRKPTTYFCERNGPYSDWLPANENTLWNTDQNTKSIYDPCPSGWRVASYDEKSPWYGLPGGEYEYWLDNAGVDWSEPRSSKNGLYPSAGRRDGVRGGWSEVGAAETYYWLSKKPKSRPDYMSFNWIGHIFYKDLTETWEARSYSVRCAQE
jgi:hypothetical protein